MQEQAHLLEEMQKTLAWDVLVDFARNAAGMKQRQVLGGNVSSLEEYKRLTGWLEGVDYVLAAAKLARQMVNTEAPNQKTA